LVQVTLKGNIKDENPTAVLGQAKSCLLFSKTQVASGDTREKGKVAIGFRTGSFISLFCWERVEGAT
jgi:hypothetical protein